jgi:DNA-binding protein H-NS
LKQLLFEPVPLAYRELPNSNTKGTENRMATYLQIAAQIEKLQTKAAQLKDKEVAGVIKRIKEAIEAYGLTAEDLGLAGNQRGPKPGKRAARVAGTKPAAGKRAAGKRVKAAPTVKFRDDAGNSWSGRGPRPGWLKKALEGGAQLESFAVKD